jgi:hypothetical protein
MTNDITRREALQRAAWLLGGTLSAPTILGVLAGCGEKPATVAWTPRTLTPDQRVMVVAIAEVIIPTTDTPGAREAHVDEFVDAMLTDHLPAKDRERFLAGLKRLDARARRAHSRGFNELTTAQQSALVSDMDRLAFAEPPQTKEAAGGAEASPRVKESDVAAGQGVGANPKEAATPAPDAADIGPESFFRMMKEFAVVGYYTSEVGSTRELRVNPFVRYRDIPYKPGTPAWA